MKAELLLFMIMIISIYSYPFLRKLADTEESCKKAGKDYQEGKPAQCKTGNTVFEVSAESECKTGTWTKNEDGVCSATAATALTETTCKGTPTYKEAEITPASCKAGNKDVPSGKESEEACKAAVKWTDTKCSVDGISIEDCTKTTTTWNDEQGTCSIGNNVVTFNVDNSDACGQIKVSWDTDKCKVTAGYTCTADDTFEVNGDVCSISTSKIDQNACENPSWKKTSDASCTAGGKTVPNISDETGCQNYQLEVIGSCSIQGVSKTECVGTYSKETEKTPASCKLETIELTDEIRLKYKSACETELVWQKGKCSNEMVSNEEDCEAQKEYTAAVEGKCVDKASSSNSFLAFKFALVLIACLLF